MIYLLFSCMVILFIISVILFIFRKKLNKEIERKNAELNSINERLTELNNALHQEQVELIKDKTDMLAELADQEDEIAARQAKISTLDVLIEQEQKRADQISNMFEKNKEMAFNAFEEWWKSLEHTYKEKEKEYDQNMFNLKLVSNKEREEIKQDLDKIRQTRAAAIEALKREQEIKDQLSFYCLQVTPAELSDIKKLESIKPQLNNPRILSMLIWSTYFQKPMTTLCNNVIGTTVKSGIYKITNQTNNICYIGQAVDLATRWKNHAKCGLGIDTPANNPLYKAMIADGIWNFSFEVLEECPREELNEKEKYYIQLYQSKDFGYNTLSGINKA